MHTLTQAQTRALAYTILVVEVVMAVIARAEGRIEIEELEIGVFVGITVSLGVSLVMSMIPLLVLLRVRMSMMRCSN
jgi:hypothetical protein